MTGMMATLFAIWLLFAAGPSFILMSVVLNALGIGVYWLAHRDQPPESPLFEGRDGLLAAGLVAIAMIAVTLLATGKVGPG